MTKEDYIKLIKTKLKGKSLKLVLQQINNFYELKSKNIKNNQYKIGDKVQLKKNMFLHGIRDLDILELVSNNDLISREVNLDTKSPKVNYCVSLWHIKKSVSLEQYIKDHSGVQVNTNTNKEDLLISYGKFDEFVQKNRKMWNYNFSTYLPMETSFIPNLALNTSKNQIAFIINGTHKECKKLLNYNLLDDYIEIEDALNFINIPNPTNKEKFINNRRYEFYDRIAYILFGLPKNMIEGILVGEKFEKDKKILKRIKQLFPGLYICNIYGNVIK